MLRKWDFSFRTWGLFFLKKTELRHIISCKKKILMFRNWDLSFLTWGFLNAGHPLGAAPLILQPTPNTHQKGNHRPLHKWKGTPTHSLSCARTSTSATSPRPSPLYFGSDTLICEQILRICLVTGQQEKVTEGQGKRGEWEICQQVNRSKLLREFSNPGNLHSFTNENTWIWVR